jgi:hypothetical protein
MPCGVVADDGCGRGRAVGNRLRSGMARCKDNCVGILDELIYGVFNRLSITLRSEKLTAQAEQKLDQATR